MARFFVVAILVVSLGGCAANEVEEAAVETGVLMSSGEAVAGRGGDEINHIPMEISVAADTPDRVIDYTIPTRIFALPEDQGGKNLPFQDMAIFDVNSEPRTDATLVERLLPAPEEPSAPRNDPVVTEIPPAPKPPVRGGVTGNSYLIQLGALPSRVSARREWTRIERRHPELIRNQVLTIVPVELNSQDGTVFRLRAGPISEIKSARSLCRKFRSDGQDCFVVKTENPT